ncbi:MULTISPECIES: hypothetical protein [unclassified Pseudomonas]|uniref:hypothetical protein n=1 Tax=unclassified Pseudomonas TaxID=196821 RepID=UPI0011129412|nr:MULTISPECIES: hypothetical protein [unclassified Pseudomonas]
MPNFLGFILVFLINFSAFAVDDHGGKILHGPFPAMLLDSSSIFFSETDDKNYPVYFLLRNDKDNSTEILDKYEVSGSLPTIETVFFYRINKEKNIIVLVSWSVNSRGVGTYGVLYQIYAYKRVGKKIVANFLIKKDSAATGFDGYQDGREVHFYLKNAEAIKKYIRSRFGG